MAKIDRKFKKGDRVKVVNQYNSTDDRYAPNGTTGTIAGVINGKTDEGGSYWCNWDTDGYYGFVWGKEIELVKDYKFKVGDRVRVREDLEVGEYYGNDSFADSMSKMRGKVVTIEKVIGHSYRIVECGYNWTDEMLEPAEEVCGDMPDHPEVDWSKFERHYGGHPLPRVWTSEWSQGFTAADIADGSITADKISKDSEGGIMETITTTLKSIPNRLKKVLDKDYKAMYQLNWLNGDLERTREGNEQLLDLLFDEYKEKLGALARERVKEIEEEQE